MFGQPTPQIAALQSDLDAMAARTRDSRHLTPDAKRAKIARLWLKATEQRDRQRQADSDVRRARISQLERALFAGGGDPAAMAGYRDARDRARALDSDDDALAMLAEAERAGDTHLARAIVAIAADHEWVGCLNAYADARPGTEAQLQELLDTRAAVAATERASSALDGPSILASMQLEAGYTLNRPAELEYENDLVIAQLADSYEMPGTVIPMPAHTAPSMDDVPGWLTAS